MINTVNGKIENHELGFALVHEHIIDDPRNADIVDVSEYNEKEILSKVVPILKKLKKSGCDTIVDSTPEGTGRAVNILRECSKATGLNILTNVGAFYGDGVTKFIKNASIKEIVTHWTNEFDNGIEGTSIKPAFIKIALDDGKLSNLQEKILRAACRTSINTNMTIQCHVLYSSTVLEAVEVLKEEKLSFDKFIWAHADHECNVPLMVELGKQGMWIEVDSIGSIPYKRHVNLIKDLFINGIQNRILISQDTGWYNINKPDGGYIKPYHKIFTEFVPLCIKHGIDNIYTLLKQNPKVCFNIK